MTATPKRKNNDEKLIYVYIGNILYNADQIGQFKYNRTKVEINIRLTDLYAPFDYKIDKYETISRILIHDTQRNSLIIKDLENNINRFKTILVLTLLLSAFMGGVIIIHMTNSISIVMPSAVLILVWIVGFLRNPELLKK